MNEQLKLLIDLQSADDDIDGLKKNLAAIPVQIDRLRAGYQKEQKLLETLKAEIDVGAKERRAAERELEGYEEKIKKVKEQQFMVKTNKEYQVILHELQGMEEKKGQYEEKILTIMEQAGEGDAKIKAQESKVAGEKVVFQAQESKLLAEKAGLENSLKEAEDLKAGVVARIDKENLRTYMKLRDFHKGRAVAAVVEGICQGCHITLRPQKFQEVKMNDGVQTCDECKRIVYHLETKVEEKPPAVEEG